MPDAARAADLHTCPVADPSGPHVGGPVLPPGAPSVLIGAQPAARAGDLAMCVGPPDTIVMGEASVLIGGSPAARRGDATAHGGVLVAGDASVQIGIPAQGAVLRAAARSGAPFAERCP